MSDVRARAARVLLAVGRGRMTLADATELARADLGDPRDRALLFEIVSGTLRWRNEIDAVITGASGRPVDAIDAVALAVIRLGAYQLRHLTRVPPHAVVDDAVDAVRALGAPKAAGFVNAVLRSIVRRGARVRLPPRPDARGTDADRVAYLTTTLSHPAWIARRWIDRLGFDVAEAWCRFDNTVPDACVRSIGRLDREALAAALAADGIAAAPARFVPDAFHLPPGSLGRISSALRAEIVVQDEASQLVARAVGARPGDRIADLCAAPGGKTLLLASDVAARGRARARRVGAGAPEAARAGGDEHAADDAREAPDRAHDDDVRATPPIVAGDRRPRRVALLARTAAGAAHPVDVLALDAAAPLPFGAIFNRVLLDAPCSGLGTLRRNPDLKWSRVASDLARFADAEQTMLRRAADIVRPGGRLVYATCSSEPDENAEVIDAFLAADRRFTLQPLRTDAIAPALLDARGCLATSPARHGLEAFFAAMLVRRQT